MKKKVQNYIKSLGGESKYSGKTKTLYILDVSPEMQDIEGAVLRNFGYGLPFKLSDKYWNL